MVILVLQRVAERRGETVQRLLLKNPGNSPGLRPCSPTACHSLQGDRVGFRPTPSLSLLGSREESSDSGHPKSRFCFTSITFWIRSYPVRI